jgi:hypothetical protein
MPEGDIIHTIARILRADLAGFGRLLGGRGIPFPT